jgi:hemerythrin-like domain-containing protein
MSGQIAAWHAEHLNFARLLRLFEEQVTVFAQGGSPDYTLMGDIVYYLRHFPEVHHHRYENEVYERMRVRDPRLRPLADRLMQEHRVIAACGEKLLYLLELAANDAVVARAELEAAAATYLVFYRAHIEAEETQMLPPVLATLETADWAAVAATVASKAHNDPLFGPQVEQRFRALRLEIEREAASAPGHAGGTLA